MSALAFDALERPLLLWIALALAVLALVLAARRPPPALPWPAWPEALAAGGRRRDCRRALGLLLRGGTLVLLGLALAGPVALDRAPPPPSDGLDLILVLDASGSMRALDAEVAGAWRTRLELAREVVERFARQRVNEGDRVGLVVFGQTAFTQCPLTSDGALLAASLARVEAGMAGEATALGDALALAVKRAGLATTAPLPTQPAAGRVVVLLSDGRSNAGAVPVDVAAALARARGVRVHTVGIGAGGEVAMARPGGASDQAVRLERHDLDVVALERIARASGGRFFLARGSRDLEDVYTAIDALERVPRRGPPRERRRPRPEPFLAFAGVLLVMEIAVLRGPYRELP